METLKSCHFCGDSPKVSDRASNETATGHVWFIACFCGGYSANAHQHGDTKQSAAAAWNRRAAIQQAAGAVPEGVAAWQAREMLDEGWSEWREYRGEDLERWRSRVARRPDLYEIRALYTGREVGSSDHSVPCAGGGVTQPLTDEVIDVLRRCAKGIADLAEICRLWEPDHSSGKDRKNWMLAKLAEDDARALLPPPTSQINKPAGQGSVPCAGWLPIETAPDETPVWLVSEGGNIWIGERCWDGDGWMWGNCYLSIYQRADHTWASSDCEVDDDYQPVKWMPLPPPPARGNDAPTGQINKPAGQGMEGGV